MANAVMTIFPRKADGGFYGIDRTVSRRKRQR